MSTTATRPGQNARLIVPRLVQPNEEFTVRILVQHPMETGFRRDESGKVLPANVIETMTVTFDNEVLFKGHVMHALTANPSISVLMSAVKSGVLRADWRDQEGNVGAISAEVRVVGA
jgi:sulfur-oxidizing protein SoxZ